MIHFKSIFLKSLKSIYRIFFFFVYGHPVIPEPFVNDYPFPIELVKDLVTIFVVFHFWEKEFSLSIVGMMLHSVL